MNQALTLQDPVQQQYMQKLSLQPVKPSALFRSVVPRFQKPKTQTNNSLGPGCYEKSSKQKRQRVQSAKPLRQKLEWTKEANPPSIPSHDFKFGYDETEDGQLKRHDNINIKHKGEKGDTVGPGEYNPIAQEKPKAPSW